MSTRTISDYFRGVSGAPPAGARVDIELAGPVINSGVSALATAAVALTVGNGINASTGYWTATVYDTDTTGQLVRIRETINGAPVRSDDYNIPQGTTTLDVSTLDPSEPVSHTPRLTNWNHIEDPTSPYYSHPDLQAQIDAITAGATDPGSEVAQARVGAAPASLTYASLKARLDGEKVSVNVKDYGAVGDGTTDDTTACQEALDSGASHVLFAGTFKLTAPLQVSSNTTVAFAPGCKFIAAHPTSTYWSQKDVGLYGGSCCFVNKEGYALYKQLLTAGANYGDLEALGYRRAAQNSKIAFVGHAEFTTTTLDETIAKPNDATKLIYVGTDGDDAFYGAGAWGAIALYYVEDFTIESIGTSVLNGLFLFECANGTVDNVRGTLIRNAGIVGGCVQVGNYCEGIQFHNVIGYRNYCTFVADTDGGKALVANITAIDGDSATHPAGFPKSWRDVEVAGTLDSVFTFAINGGGKYQSLRIGSGTAGCKFKGTIRNAYGEAIRVNNCFDNTVEVLIDNGCQNLEGTKVTATGLVDAAGTLYKPVILVYSNGGTLPSTYNNFFDIKLRISAGSAGIDKLLVECTPDSGVIGASGITTIYNNTYRYQVLGQSGLPSFPNTPAAFVLNGTSSIVEHPVERVIEVKRTIVAAAGAVAETDLLPAFIGLNDSNTTGNGYTIPHSIELRAAESGFSALPTAGTLTLRLYHYNGASWGSAIATTAITGTSAAELKYAATKLIKDARLAYRNDTGYYKLTYQKDAGWNGTGVVYEAIARIKCFSFGG